MNDAPDSPAFVNPDDMPPAMAARPSRVVTTGGRARGSIATERDQARRYACECVLDVLRASGRIDDQAWKAGLRFAAYWRGARTAARVTADYLGAGRGRSLNDDAMAAAEKAEMAITEARTWMPPLHWLVLTSVAGEDQPVGNDRRVMLLRSALYILARGWGIETRPAVVDDVPEVENEREGRWRK